MTEPTVGPINQPDVFNIHAWDGQRWRGGMNRLKEADAISAAVAWSTQSGRRTRVYSPAGQLVFDSVATAVLPGLIAALRSAREWHLGDKYRVGTEEEQLAWREQLARYDAALAGVGGAQ